ncbi:probable tRNA (uracil-O(2)-)-methyltransferase [Sceloporus undulatus]|uniref:probable tRNA (uracil-O(2)-)-methyltransferase n=1 Tax=Sceloporus undulatus TaxID=8520 RepID=UPI001C4A88ED|nr:probable tRNA (uracil-O(2)-)-methyltransferase [Sceloporus undulatus]
MEVLGTASVRDPDRLLPGGFWEAVGVWLEKPQVANKRLCGARLDGARRVAPSTAAAAGGLWEAAWRALRPSVPWEALALDGCPEEGEVEVVFRTLVPKVSPPSPARELVVKDIGKGIVTFLPLEQTPEGKCKIKKCNVYQIRLLHMKNNEW